MNAWEGLTPPYSTIVADPPWRGYGGVKGNPDRHYSTMPTPDICALDVPAIAADDAHLYLWTNNRIMADGFRVVEAWGFEVCTILTWCKPGPGVGYYFRNNTEHAIFATRGKPMVPDHAPTSTWWLWSRGAHSAKPDAFGDLVEQVSPGPYVELFCRRPRLGWDSWGKGYELSEAA